MTGGTNLARSTSTNDEMKSGAAMAGETMSFREHGSASPPAPPLWVFGYGSLIWKPNFPYEDRVVGRIRGYARKFWLGDEGHRGSPGAPGRVATLVEKKNESTWGVALKVNASQVCSTIAYLNTRERGYAMHRVTFYPCKSREMPPITVLVYIGSEASPSYLGPASEENIARQVVRSRGCSGPNTDYVLNLATSMREIAPEEHDDHLFLLEAKIKELLQLQPLDKEERVITSPDRA